MATEAFTSDFEMFGNRNLTKVIQREEGSYTQMSQS